MDPARPPGSARIRGPRIRGPRIRGPRIRGLYVVTAPGPGAPGGLTRTVAAALVGGARVVQYRDKTDAWQRRRKEARELAQLCHEHDAVFIVNDDCELAADSGADGVHLGRDDATVAAARNRLGPDALIGVSCYDSLERALAAQAAGADYVAFGSFFPSPTKPGAVRAPRTLLEQARRALTVPIVAIGGITPQNGGGLVAAGAHALAVVTGVFAQPDPQVAAREYAALFGQ